MEEEDREATPGHPVSDGTGRAAGAAHKATLSLQRQGSSAPDGRAKRIDGNGDVTLMEEEDDAEPAEEGRGVLPLTLDGAPGEEVPLEGGYGADEGRGLTLARRNQSASAQSQATSSASQQRRTHRSYRDLWLRFAAASCAGRKPDGAIKVNQDSYLVHTRLLGLRYAHVFAVFDGHGRVGHEVSAFLREHFAAVLEEELARLPQDSLLHNARARLSRTAQQSELRRMARVLKRAINRVEAMLFERGKAPPAAAAAGAAGAAGADQRFWMSGSTAVVALLLGRHCIVANVGDSRCVLLCSPERDALAADELNAAGKPAWRTLPVHVRQRGATRGADASSGAPSGAAAAGGGPGSALGSRTSSADTASRASTASHLSSASAGWPAPEVSTDTVRLRLRPLTVDQKPDADLECRRIERHGGEVRPLRDPHSGTFVGPARVWAAAPGGRGPGLAMSRSVGDGLAAACGVISDPVVTYHYLRPRADHFLVLGSDGVWEFMQATEVVETMRAAAEVTDAAVSLCRAAQLKWVHTMNASGSHTIDDITALVLALWPGAYADED